LGAGLVDAVGPLRVFTIYFSVQRNTTWEPATNQVLLLYYFALNTVLAPRIIVIADVNIFKIAE
jgi:hypothetical protein